MNSYLYLAPEDDTLKERINEMVMQSKRQQILQKYEGKIWQGTTNKFWYVKIDGRLIKKKERHDLEDLIVQTMLKREEEVNFPTIEELFYQWADDRLQRKRIAYGTYNRQVNEYKKHFNETEFGQRRINSMSEADWINFLEVEVARLKLTSKGLSRFKEIVKGILLHAKKKSLIDFNVIDMLAMADIKPFPTVKNDSTQVFNKDEFQKIREYAMNHIDGRNLAILLLTVTGLRPGEIVSLKWEDVDDLFIHVSRTETAYYNKDIHVVEVKDSPKTEAANRDVVLAEGNKWIIDEIKKLKRYDDGFVFRKERSEDRLTAGSLDKRFRTIQRHLNIPVRSLNKIRKTYGTILCDAKADNRFILKQMGHTDIATTEGAYHRDRRTLEEKCKNLSAITELTINCSANTKKQE